MVKRSRDQSTEAPMRRSWRVMRPPDSRFHCQTRSTKASRPSARRLSPARSSRRSTTSCVAMPAWSVPGCHSAARPCMRRQRVRMSIRVSWKAWPMCSEPVTFGGGSMTHQGRPSAAGAKAPAASQRRAQSASSRFGS